jgi:peptide/nickel transport system substrate-binding protein
MLMRRRLVALALLSLALACSPQADRCPRCDTLVIAAVGEPDHLLPPFVWQSVGRDIQDLVFERLAILDPDYPPLDPSAYRPGLAARWERVDSVSWRFHLRPGARWHDGTPVTAEDVVYSFEAYQDPELDALARGSLAGLRATAEDSATVRIRFDTPRPDQFYDATFHVRVFPRHLWDSVPRDRWGVSADLARLVGSGAYRLVEWRRGEWLTLEAVGREPDIRRVTWRFASAPDAAVNMLLAGEADLLETLMDPARQGEVDRAPHLRIVRYPSAVYGYLGFNLAGAAGPWHDVRVRRALRLGLDRSALVRAMLGPGTAVPPGPLSAQLWLWEAEDPGTADTVEAGRLLDEAGWPRGSDGLRRRGGRILAMDILVPGTSAARRNLAVAMQERWGRLGVRVTVTQVDFPVFQERLGRGAFESYIGASLDEPHPRSLREQWSRAGWGGQNYGRYDGQVFDSLLAGVVDLADSGEARRLWREALTALDRDVPAIWLYTPANVAVVHRRLELTRLAPFAWLAELPRWRLTGEGP